MKAYLKLDFNFIVMIYYHHTHLEAAFKILNDQKIIEKYFLGVKLIYLNIL